MGTAVATAAMACDNIAFIALFVKAFAMRTFVQMTGLSDEEIAFYDAADRLKSLKDTKTVAMIAQRIVRVPDEDKVRRLAAALFTNERYIEKDWHLVRALGIIASIGIPGTKAAFSGGTSLSSAWQLIHRFSEDIDFKVALEGVGAEGDSR